MVILVAMDFSVDPASLRSDGRRIEAVRAGAEGDLRRMHGGTTPGAAVWGADVPVAPVYDALTAATGDVLDLIGAVLAESGAGARQMAAEYERADEAARARFHDLGGWTDARP